MTSLSQLWLWSPLILLPNCTKPVPNLKIFSICTYHCIQNAEKYRVQYLDHLNLTTIAWSTFRSISSIDHLHHPPLFFLWLAAAARFHEMHCAMPPWAHRSHLAIRPWRWTDHHLRVYRVQIWASLSLDDSISINILQKSSIFTLEQIWTFLLSSSS